MRAIEKTIEALRGLERWGAKEMVNAPFRGFKALPASVTATLARSVEVSPTAGPDIIRAAYRSKASDTKMWVTTFWCGLPR